MTEENKEATVIFNDKRIPMSQLSFQTQRNMQKVEFVTKLDTKSSRAVE